jgi:hypothetical protein
VIVGAVAMVVLSRVGNRSGKQVLDREVVAVSASAVE